MHMICICKSRLPGCDRNKHSKIFQHCKTFPPKKDAGICLETCLLQMGKSWQGCIFAYAPCVTKATEFVGAAAPSPPLPLPVLPVRHSQQSNNPPLGFAFLSCLLPQSWLQWRETYPTREEEVTGHAIQNGGSQNQRKEKTALHPGQQGCWSGKPFFHAFSLGRCFGEGLVVANLNKQLVPTVWKSPTVSHQLWH